MKFLMTVSHQPPVNPAARDLFDDFYIRQAAGQAVVDIRFEAGDPGAARRENFTVAEKDRRRILRQYLIQLVVDRLTFLDVEHRVTFGNQLIDLRVVIAGLFRFRAVKIPHAIMRVVKGTGAERRQIVITRLTLRHQGVEIDDLRF